MAGQADQEGGRPEESGNGDALGGYGGEELRLILPAAAPQRPFLPIDRLRHVVAETPFSYNGADICVTASFGVAWLGSASGTTEDLLARADYALYASQDAGRQPVGY